MYCWNVSVQEIDKYNIFIKDYICLADYGEKITRYFVFWFKSTCLFILYLRQKSIWHWKRYFSKVLLFRAMKIFSRRLFLTFFGGIRTKYSHGHGSLRQCILAITQPILDLYLWKFTCMSIFYIQKKMYKKNPKKS